MYFDLYVHENNIYFLRTSPDNEEPIIKINETFRVEKDKYQWLLIETKDGLSKTQEPIKTTRTTYHGTLKQCCNQISERMMGECESVKELVDALGFFESTLDNLFDNNKPLN